VNTPALSVGLSSYNHARYLPEALESILSKSYQPLEVIVIDNASTDHSAEVLRVFAQRKPPQVLVGLDHVALFVHDSLHIREPMVLYLHG